MAAATHVVTSFLGGELSKYAEGRFDKPDYKTSMRTCLNAFPCEAGAWMRRPGTKDAGTTLNGAPGRVMEFEIEEQAALTLEFTDGNLRFRSGATLVPTVYGGVTPLVLTTPYIGGSWASSTLRGVQAETTQILLSPGIAPQALVATTLPADGVVPTFTLNPAVFNDGPYLDPFTNGVQATPSAKSGIIALSLSFVAYDATKAYRAGDFVSTGGVNYRSLLDQNAGNAPAGGAPWWTTASVTEAINGGRGFLGSDIGRLVRLFSEPAAWVSGSTYAQYAVVSYNPTGLAGAATYWSSLVASNTGNTPGADLKNWTLITSAAIWSWGKITSLSNTIDRALAGSVAIGNMTSGGGLAAAFDGVFSQAAASSAERTGSGTSLSSYVGKNFSGASDQKIQQATIYPSNDGGFVVTAIGPGGVYPTVAITLNLRGKASAPSSASDGTLLGTSGSIPNTFSAVTIVSTDQSTAWKYVWVEMISTVSFSTTISNIVAELSLFNPPGTGTGSGVNVEIIGSPLLYTTTVSTWRLGAFSDTTGYPTCGIYNDGRLYLGGATGNQFDASYANGIVGGTVNFAPTDQYGAVTAAHAISYTFNSKGVNQILWMRPDLQGVKAGTQKGEWIIQAPTAGPISPLNISARQVTSHGSANIEPVDTEHTLVFAQRFARKLLEYFPDVFSGKFSAPNLADKAEHIVAAGVAELAYTSAVTPIIWGRDASGALFGIVYKRDSLSSAQPPTFYGWHRHTLGSGRIVESICAGPSVGGDLDALTMVTSDPATGIRRVEILTDTPSEDTDESSAWQLDGAVNPTVTIGASSAVLSGLPWADGTVVQASAGLDGILLDLGDLGDEAGVTYPTDFTVSGGAITVPYGDGISAGPGRGLFTRAFAMATPASQIVVGFVFNSDGQIVKPLTPADSGSRSGPAFGLIQRIHRASFGLVGSFAFQIGMSFSKLMSVHLKQTDDRTAWPAGQAYTGLHGETMNGDYTRDSSLCWRSSRVFPLTITQLAANLESMDQ